MTQSSLIAHTITKQFLHDTKVITVLDTIEKKFVQGKTYAITGPSGSGKSTLLHLLAGLDVPTFGDVIFDNLSLTTASSQQRAQYLQKSIGLVFQSPSLIRELSVIENVILPGLIAGHDTYTMQQHAQELLATVGLFHLMHAQPGELSGGQQQRVALARALINTPTFLLADEPTGNLDATTGKKITELLLTCCTQKNIGIIVSTHDPYLASAMVEVCTLTEGKLISTNLLKK